MRHKVFISYSRKDNRWRERLVEQLCVLEMAGILEVWDDTKLRGGDQWREELNRAMLECRVALILVSPAFLTSRFIVDNEVPQLIECHADDGMRLIPLLVRSCPWEAVAWLERLQLLPRDGQPLAGRRSATIDRELTAVAYAVREQLDRDKRG